MKKKFLGFLMGTSLVFALAACGGGDDKADNDKAGNNGGGGTETASNGDAAELYNNKCMQCHGENLEGAVGPQLSKIGSKYSKEEIENIINNGKGGGMPKGLYTGDDAATLAEWLAGKK